MATKHPSVEPLNLTECLHRECGSQVGGLADFKMRACDGRTDQSKSFCDLKLAIQIFSHAI